MKMTKQPIVVGDTVDFYIHAQKDDSIWDITGGTVTLFLKNPAGTVTSYTATLSAPTQGEAHYAVSTSVLATAGDWYRQWKISAGGVVLYSNQIKFAVVAALG